MAYLVDNLPLPDAFTPVLALGIEGSAGGRVGVFARERFGAAAPLPRRRRGSQVVVARPFALPLSIARCDPASTKTSCHTL